MTLWLIYLNLILKKEIKLEKFCIEIEPKQVAETIKYGVKKIIEQLNLDLSLSIYNTIETPASLSYVKGKIKDCESVGIKVNYIGAESIQDGKHLAELIKADNSTGIIVQKPLREDISEEDYLSAIKDSQDVDGAKPLSDFVPATPQGIMDWLWLNSINLDGKDICIIGRSEIVGMPLARMMTENDATVTLCHSKTKNLKEKVQNCDILVVAIGNPNIIKPEWLEDGKPRIVIDVGINRVDGELVGDVPSYKVPEGGYCTPVPGGVGLLTRAELIYNIVSTYSFTESV